MFLIILFTPFAVWLKKMRKKLLTELINDPNIIIKSADKGAIVVQYKSKYQHEIISQLQNFMWNNLMILLVCISLRYYLF